MISDFNKLGIALKSLDAMKFGTVGVNLENVEAYRVALKGLSVEQSVFALASKGATEEQIRQILVTNQATASEVEAAMAKAGLTTATQALTQAEMVEMATKSGVAKAEAEALLSKIGITATEESQVVVKKQVTLAMLEQAVASGTLTKAEASQIATMLGLNAAETANIGITNVLTASFTKLWAVITAHPIGAILTAIGAVAVGTIAYINKVNKDAEKALVEAHENAKQALEDTNTSLSDNKSKLQSVNSELEQTKDKIKEISSIGAPTLAEQNELNKLSIANSQLEAQKTLLENNIRLKQRSAALDAKELLGTQTELKDYTLSDKGEVVENTEKYDYKKAAELNAFNLKEAYKIYLKAISDGNAQAQEEAKSLVDSVSGESATLTSEILNIIESFKYDDGTIVEGYEDLYKEYMGIIYNIQSLTNPDTFLEIAKSVTAGTNIDYEKVIEDAYKSAYEGNFDIDNLNQDFLKALEDSGISKETVEYIFNLKQQEYQSIIDKINTKYNSSNSTVLLPSNATDEERNQALKNNESRKSEVDKINKELTDYAKENPIEFQLVTSYDEGFKLLDQYVEEEKSKIQSVQNELQSLSEQGNVDLTIRPVIDSSAMKAAGWDVEDGSIATTFTQGEFIWQGGEDDGQYVYVHYTPILPDGTVLTPDQLSNYLYGTLESSKNILEADDKGIVLKVDTDLQGVSAEDIKQLQEKGIQTDGMKSFLNSMGQWDDSVHTVQESYYDMSGTVDYVDNAIKRLVEDAKKAEGIDTNETDILSVNVEH